MIESILLGLLLVKSVLSGICEGEIQWTLFSEIYKKIQRGCFWTLIAVFVLMVIGFSMRFIHRSLYLSLFWDILLLVIGGVLYILLFIGYIYLAITYGSVKLPAFRWLILFCPLPTIITSILLTLILSDVISGGIVLAGWVFCIVSSFCTLRIPIIFLLCPQPSTEVLTPSCVTSLKGSSTRIIPHPLRSSSSFSIPHSPINTL